MKRIGMLLYIATLIALIATPAFGQKTANVIYDWGDNKTLTLALTPLNNGNALWIASIAGSGFKISSMIVYVNGKSVLTCPRAQFPLCTLGMDRNLLLAKNTVTVYLAQLIGPLVFVSATVDKPTVTTTGYLLCPTEPCTTPAGDKITAN